MNWVTHFGVDDWSWNLETDDDHDDVEGDGSGMPGASLVASAIVVWLGLQGRPVGVSVVADTFSLPAELVTQAVAVDDNLNIRADGPIYRTSSFPPASLASERDPRQGLTSYDLSNAIGVWAALRDDRPTVETAALTFMISPNRVRQAVEEHYWMFLGAGDVIEHDGE